MKTRTRRIIGGILLAVGVVLAVVVVIAPVWNAGLLAAMVAAGMIVGGWQLLTDRRPGEEMLRDGR